MLEKLPRTLITPWAGHVVSIAHLTPAKVLNTEQTNSGLMHYKHFTREKQPVTQAWCSMNLDDSLFFYKWKITSTMKNESVIQLWKNSNSYNH